MNFMFFVTNALLGIALAMDAFSVALANGLNEPCMKKSKTCIIAGTFSLFQFAMPMIGWICVSTIAEIFENFRPFIPWIAFLLLGYIGGKMLYEGIKNPGCSDEKPAVGFGALVIQGIATSIDALTAGFEFENSNYEAADATIACLIIGVLTFGICIAGIFIGKKFGTKIAGKASVLGGVILLAIALKTIITSWL